MIRRVIQAYEVFSFSFFSQLTYQLSLNFHSIGLQYMLVIM